MSAARVSPFIAERSDIREGQAVSVENRLTADEILATIHPHPTYSEALREATLAAEHRPIHIFQRQRA